MKGVSTTLSGQGKFIGIPVLVDPHVIPHFFTFDILFLKRSIQLRIVFTPHEQPPETTVQFGTETAPSMLRKPSNECRRDGVKLMLSEAPISLSALIDLI